MQTHDSNNHKNQQQHEHKKTVVQQKTKKQKKNINSPFDGTKDWQEIANNSPQAIAQRKQANRWNNSPKMVAQRKAIEKNTQLQQNPNFLTNRNSIENVNNANIQLKKIGEKEPKQLKTESKQNKTGLPDNLKSGIENLSGHSMDDVKVHYNSDKPAQLQAHAYAQGTDIHLGAGQEKHLAHEAWHVVQQKQGRVKPTMQMKDKVNVNDDDGLEKEADVMGAKALQMKTKSNSDTRTLKNTIDTSETIQGYFIQEGSDGESYKVANDLSLAVRIEPDSEKKNQTLYAKIGKAAAANTKLKSINSGIELIETNIRPIEDQPFAKIEMKNKKDGSAGADMQIYADCGHSNAVIMGSKDRTAIYKDPSSRKISRTNANFPSKMKSQIMTKWLKKKKASKNTSETDKQKIKEIEEKAKVLKEEIGDVYEKYEDPKYKSKEAFLIKKFYRLYRKRADVIWSFYYNLSKSEQSRIDKELGINAYAKPNVGQGYTISRGGEKHPEADDETWNYHWAGVIMESDNKNDKVTLENYSLSDPSIKNNLWLIEMYGTLLKEQTFHEIHNESKNHGKSPTTMAIEKRRKKK